MRKILERLHLINLCWLEDFDGSLHLRWKKTKKMLDGIEFRAERMRCNIYPLRLISDGTVRPVDSSEIAYVHYWHPYERGKVPVTRKTMEEKKKATKAAFAAANASMQSLINQNISQLSAFQFNSNLPQLFGGVNLTPPAPRPILSTDTRLVYPVVAWRRWQVDMFGTTLRSNNKTQWEPFRRLEARCIPSGPKGPEGECSGVHCSCGIYGYKERQQSAEGENAPTETTHVWGEVWLWGRVVEHEHGFRAQFAYPKSFVNSGGIAEQLSVAYGVKLID